MGEIEQGYLLSISGHIRDSLRISVYSRQGMEFHDFSTGDNGPAYKFVMGDGQRLFDGEIGHPILGLLNALAGDDERGDYVSFMYATSQITDLEGQIYQTALEKLMMTGSPDDLSEEEHQHIEASAHKIAQEVILQVRAQEAHNAVMKEGVADRAAAAPLN